MNKISLHIDHSNDTLFFRSGKINWIESEAAVWEKISQKINEVSPKAGYLNPGWFYGLAASIILFLGAGFFLAYYSKTFTAPAGEHFTAFLPDGSTVKMNAASSVTYYPARWHFGRKVYFEGEGFFEVLKGNDFEVQSSIGITKVMGTSFNVFSREEAYKVTCFTGSVMVSGVSKNSAVLNPGDYAEIDKEGNIRILKNYKVENVEAWRLNQFNFTGTPLKEVVNEIERQYNVKIELQKEFNLNYSGNFFKKPTVEEVLVYVCRPLNINFVKKSEKNYLIFENN